MHNIKKRQVDAESGPELSADSDAVMLSTRIRQQPMVIDLVQRFSNLEELLFVE